MELSDIFKAFYNAGKKQENFEECFLQHMTVTAVVLQEMSNENFQWKNPDDDKPEPRPGLQISERVLVYYESDQSGIHPTRVSCYGIAYYHYAPPYAEPGFVDFAHYGRKPKMWTRFIKAPIDEI